MTKRVNKIILLTLFLFKNNNDQRERKSDKMINIRKRGSGYQYCFEAGKVNGKGKIKQIINKKDLKSLTNYTVCGIIISRGDIYGIYDYKRSYPKMEY